MKRPNFKEQTHQALYCKKIDLRCHKKIDRICEKMDVAKWLVVDKIISDYLGVNTNNPLDLSKWIKK